MNRLGNNRLDAWRRALLEKASRLDDWVRLKKNRRLYGCGRELLGSNSDLVRDLDRDLILYRSHAGSTDLPWGLF